ncbi:MAG: extracellular matrix/biofilm biosynthesis regulator RemA family protein [Planctomycetota bacterium]
MPIEILNIGLQNVVAMQRIVAVTAAGSSPLRRLVENAERQHRLIDATSGRKTRSIIVTDSNHVILSHMNPATLAQKLEHGNAKETPHD